MISPLIFCVLLFRLVTRRDAWEDFAERMGYVPRRAGTDKAIWVHGASLGELSAARDAIDQLHEQSGRPITVTCNTASARDMLRGWESEHITCHYAPADTPGALARMIRRQKIGALVTLEGELWPLRFFALRAVRAPVYLLAARLSARSAARGGLAARLHRMALARVTRAWPLDAPNRERLVSAGLSPLHIGPELHLKAMAPVPATAHPPASPDLAPWAGKRVLLIASTHAGEEARLMPACARALAERPDLRLILAPRHTERGDEAAGAIEAAGLSYARRSKNHPLTAETPVYLADTLQEMPLWYSRAEIAVLGGSFVPVGGHSPAEALHFGCLPAHGPHVETHETLFFVLDYQQAAIRLEDEAALQALLRDLPSPDDCRAMAARGRAVLDEAAAEARQRMAEIAAEIAGALS